MMILNMSTQKKDVIVKVGECWITPETVETHVPKNCVVNCDPIEMNVTSDFPALLKPIDGVKYEVY